MKNVYKPTKKEKKVLSFLKEEIEEFVDRRNQQYPEFNDRTLKDFLDDGNKRLNTYVLPRESQNKEDWQANVAMPTIRNKMKQLIAGFSLIVPKMNIKAYGGKGKKLSLDRAEVAKKLISGSYNRNTNIILENFWEIWEGASKGTTVEYEGYLKSEYKQKYIKDYDIVTGEIESGEKTVNPDDNCVSILLPLTEFFVKDFYINDIQEQPSVAWVQYLSEDQFEREFGQYKKANKVETGIPSSTDQSDIETFYYSMDRKEDHGDQLIEVIRYYNKLQDRYIIVANGVVLLDAPLLWKLNGKKKYPFAKSIWEPFVGKHFFYGNSLPNLMTGQYDVYNALMNSTIDKQYRSFVRPLLIGMINRDQFNLEDEILDTSTKIYVNDVNQAKPMKTERVNDADIKMLQLMQSGLESVAPSLPNVMANKDATARETVIAEEKLQQLKSINKELITDLWRQKYELRLANIKLNYPQPRKVVDEDGKEEEYYRTFMIHDTELEKDTGEIGTLAIQFAEVNDKNRDRLQNEVDVEEEMMEQQGINYKKMIIDPEYLDNYEYSISVVPESVVQSSKAKEKIETQKKAGIVAQMFPKIFAVNKEAFFTELLEGYDDDNIGKYIGKYRAMQKMMQQMKQQQAALKKGQQSKGRETNQETK